jgi:hypothetical protein
MTACIMKNDKNLETTVRFLGVIEPTSTCCSAADRTPPGDQTFLATDLWLQSCVY